MPGAPRGRKGACIQIFLVCCLAHCRRKFFEAVPAGRKKKLKLLDINFEQEIQEPDQEFLKDSELAKLAEQVKKNAEKLIMLEKYKDAEMLLKEILKYVPDDSEILDLIQLCNN